MGTKCWSLLLVDWTLFSGVLARLALVSKSPKSILKNPGITSVPATRGTLFYSPLGDDRSGWKKKLTGIYRMVHPVHLIIKIFFFWGYLLWAFIWDKNTFVYFAYSERSVTYLFSKFPCHQFSNYVPFTSLTIHPNHWLQPVNCYVVTHLVISLSKQTE